jgi:hypothetical protein
LRAALTDLVLFNAQTIADCATYENPNQYPVRRRAVIVNGKIVVRYEYTGALPKNPQTIAIMVK